MPIVDGLALNNRVVWDHEPRPRRVGVVLGGGAARGIAHIGALQVLEENGIYPQVVAGTSVGALVGGLYAAGVSPVRMASLLPELKWLDLASFKMPTINLSDLAKNIPMGVLDLDRLIVWVDELLGGPVEIQQLNIPFAAVATDVLTGDIMVMNEGSLAAALRASCSVPGIFTPYHRNGRLLMDGVVTNNLPVSVARDLRADYVIAIELLPLTQGPQAEPRNMMELAMTALFMLARSTQIEQHLADIVVAPAIAHFNLADLSAADELLEAGRQAMAAMIPQIAADLGK